MSYRAEATEERDAKIYALFGAVNHYPDADYLTTQLIDGGYHLVYRTTGGQNVVYNENPLAGADVEASPEGSRFGSFPFSKYAAYTELPGRFKGKDNTTGSWAGYHLYLLFLEVNGNHVTKLFSVFRRLQNLELLPVDGGV